MDPSKLRPTCFCRNRVATLVRPRKPRLVSNPISSPTKAGNEPSATNGKNNFSGSGSAKPGMVLGKRIMIVVDSSSEAKAALQWALSHAVQSHDTLVLLDVTKPSPNHGNERKNVGDPRRRYRALYGMKKLCHARKPEVNVEISLVEGKERGPAIVEEAKRQGVSLLVLGQKKRWTAWRLVVVWAGGRIKRGGVVDYCLQNASCMALAVRRKGGRSNGYLISTRRHKDFWLLA